jgi:uncharacterized protein (TIGR04255 family)
MDRFPEASLLYRQQIVLANIPPGGQVNEGLPNNPDESNSQKVWQFRSPQSGYVNMQSNSVVIQSDFHKTYNNPKNAQRFRDSIQFVMDAFIELTRIPLLTRIGLRYIDECPIPEKNNETFSTYYNSVFPLARFNLTDATEMDFKTVVKKGDSFVRYVESLQRSEGDTYKLILDFDGFQERVSADQYLIVTDHLHDLISAEFEASIKNPVYDFMRQPKGG